MTIGILPHSDGEVGACLFTSEEEKPSENGAMIYLNANGRLDEAIADYILREYIVEKTEAWSNPSIRHYFDGPWP